MPTKSHPSNGTSELYGRISSLEAGLQSLQTELSGYAKHTTDAIASLADQISGVAEASERRLEKTESDFRDALRTASSDFKQYRDSNRPNWYALAAVFVSVAVALGSLIKSSTDAQVRPNTILTQNNAQRIGELKQETKDDLAQETRILKEVAELYREMNLLAHSQIDGRLDKIEASIAVRMSDADDRQDAEIRSLKQICDLVVENGVTDALEAVRKHEHKSQ